MTWVCDSLFKNIYKNHNVIKTINNIPCNDKTENKIDNKNDNKNSNIACNNISNSDIKIKII